jgi:hypothetical protein
MKNFYLENTKIREIDIGFLDMIIGDGTKVIGNCIVCYYEMGYSYGSNASSFPIGCSYASYTPGHIACPKCGAGYLVGDLYNPPQNIKEAIELVSIPESAKDEYPNKINIIKEFWSTQEEERKKFLEEHKKFLTRFEKFIEKNKDKISVQYRDKEKTYCSYNTKNTFGTSPVNETLLEKIMEEIKTKGG